MSAKSIDRHKVSLCTVHGQCGRSLSVEFGPSACRAIRAGTCIGISPPRGWKALALLNRDRMMFQRLAQLIRPICPHCDGKGGFMDGYYEPEWSGCRCCDPNEDRMDEPVTRVWRWQSWAFQIREWRERRRLDRWIDQQPETRH